MAGLNGVLGTSLSGLQAYRAALNTISENVSNATTPGYGRRRAELAARFQGPGQSSGTGVDVKAIQRVSSRFADTRLRGATADKNQADARVDALTTLQSNFSSNGGISSALNRFFSDAKSLSTQPSSQPARQTLLSDGKQLAAKFNQVAGSIHDSLNNLSQSAAEITKQANQLLQQLAHVNQSLRNRAGQNSNTLLDNQQATLQNLAKLVNAHVIRHANGTVRLSVRGQVLLDPAGASELTLVQKPGAKPQIRLPSGHTLDPGATGGKLGGTLIARAQSQAQLQNINRLATVTAGLVNGQQALGLDTSGQQGRALFTLPTPTVVAQPVNSGTATLNARITDSSRLPANGGPYHLRYNGNNYVARNEANGKTFNAGSGSTLNFKGLEVNVSGTPGTGDQFTLDPVGGAAAGLRVTTSDPGAIAAAAPYAATAGTVSAGGAVTNTNAGGAEVAAGEVTDSPPGGTSVVPASYFGQSVQVKFTSPGNYQVQTNTGTVISSSSYSPNNGAAVAFAYPPGAAGGKYFQFDFSGRPAAGDTFTLSPGGSQSGQNADALGQLNAAPLLQGSSLNDAYSYVTSAVGTAVHSAQTSQSNAKANVASTQSARNAVSGVSLDEQAGQLQLYTQAYQASAKALATTNQLFQSLLNVV